MSRKIIGALILVLILNLPTLKFCQGEEEEEKTKGVLQDLTFDKKTGVVSYELTIPAWVRIRIGIADGPLYRTLVDWQKREAGKHKEEWDGRDSSGTVKLTGREDLVFTFNYFTANDEYLRHFQVADILPLAGNLAGRHLPSLKVNQLHKKHPRNFCHEATINIVLPKNIPKNKDGFYIIKAKVPVEIDITQEDRSWFRAERYSLHIFLDDVFVQGELDGYVPYTWVFDPKDLNEGAHLILVNLAGFNDHYGIASLPIYIQKENRSKDKR